MEGGAPLLTYYAGQPYRSENWPTAVAFPGVPADAGTYTVVASFAGSARIMWRPRVPLR